MQKHPVWKVKNVDCFYSIYNLLFIFYYVRKFFTPTSKEGKLMISINGKDSVSQIGWGK